MECDSSNFDGKINWILWDLHNSLKNDSFIITELCCFWTIYNRITYSNNRPDTKTTIRAEFQCLIDIGSCEAILAVSGNWIGIIENALDDFGLKKWIDINFFRSGVNECVLFNPMQFDMEVEDYKLIKKKTDEFRNNIKNYMNVYFRMPSI